MLALDDTSQLATSKNKFTKKINLFTKLLQNKSETVDRASEWNQKKNGCSQTLTRLE